MADRSYLDALTRRLADEGKIIEAGWVAMRLAVIPVGASAAQLDDMRLAFMAGAQHLFASIVTMFDAGDEPSNADPSRMDMIHRELEAYGKELELRVHRPKGSA